MIRIILISVLTFFSLSFVVFAQDSQNKSEDYSFGGDIFVAGDKSNVDAPVEGDVFATGYNVNILNSVGEDAHAAGYSVTINGDVGGDVYTMGRNVTINGNIGDDLSAMGENILILGKGVGGNARLAGSNITLTAPISGSATIAAQKANIDAAIEGDFMFSGEKISFSDNAKINGFVTIKSTNDIIVPPNVASADRVSIEKLKKSNYSGDMRDIAHDSIRGFFPDWLSGIVKIIIFALIGIIWLTIFKKKSLIAYNVALDRPWKSVFFGVLGLAAFIGLIPVVAMTIIGIPLVPVLIVLLVIAGVIGYVAGVWFIGSKVMSSLGQDIEPMGNRFIALIAGLVGAWILSLIPFIGWLVSLVILYIGLGAISYAALVRWIDKDFYNKISSELAS